MPLREKKLVFGSVYPIKNGRWSLVVGELEADRSLIWPNRMAKRPSVHKCPLLLNNPFVLTTLSIPGTYPEPDPGYCGVDFT